MLRDKKTKVCDHPECKREGTCRAPKNRELKDYYWFCEKHAAEYNKSWNYYAGLSFEEIEAETRADETWRTQTFKFGLDGVDLAKAMKNGKLEDPHELFGRAFKGAAKKSAVVLSRKQTAALELLGLTYPLNATVLKAAYKRHAKIHHPDLNKGSKKSEEKFKEISAAFATLKVLVEGK